MALRKGNWKLLLQPVSIKHDVMPALYDLSVDIHEDHNLAQQNPKLVNELLVLIKSAHIDSELFHFGMDQKSDKNDH